jgi:small subunit ribosomal protein S2
MKRFIFTERNGIYIIDLQQSLAYIDRSFEFVKGTVARGGQVLFVGTKKQAQEAIAEQSMRVGMPYVNQRWLGGMLTNFQTVNKRLPAPQGARGHRLRRRRRFGAYEEGAAGHAPGEDQARAQPRRDPRHGAHPGSGVDRGHQEGAPGGRRGQEAGYPDRGVLDTNCDPRRRRLPDPGQRRRPSGPSRCSPG